MKKEGYLERFRKSLDKGNPHPITVALAVGLYPIISYYSNNFTLVNSWKHLGFFLFFFIFLPILLFYTVTLILKKLPRKNIYKYVLPFLNIFLFLFLTKISIYAGINKKLALAIFFISILLAVILHKHFKKIVLFEYLLIIVGLFNLAPVLVKNLTISNEWKLQPDTIEQIVFKNKPNVYFIQPDGYVNFSELNKGHYSYDNSEFENFLTNNGFKNYADFRSNYSNTLASNSSMMMLKHHYHNNQLHPSEGLNARNILVSSNVVLNAFKNNGYTTHLILEAPYIMLNKPKMGFHKSNFLVDDVPYIGKGFENKRKVVDDLEHFLAEADENPMFFFIEFFNPGHIANHKGSAEGKEKEREKWIKSLEHANTQLKDFVGLIKENDPNALIIILADHGGYLGLEYAMEMYTKTQDRDILYSIFSSQLSIHWPENNVPEFDTELKSTVNLFRIVFSYLSEDTKYLDALQEDASYLTIHKGAPEGVYKYIDKDGNIVFEKVN